LRSAKARDILSESLSCDKQQNRIIAKNFMSEEGYVDTNKQNTKLAELMRLQPLNPLTPTAFSVLPRGELPFKYVDSSGESLHLANLSSRGEAHASE